MVVPEDIFVAISYSGETAELIRLLPFLRSNANETLAITGNPRSTIAVNATYHLCVRVDKEACPLQLAPTASTTATLAMGDAIAVALMKARGFESHHFARFHPGGSLGRLLSRVRDEMVTRNLPFILPDASANEVITAVTGGKLGVALVSDEHRHLLGIITDGDLRRALVANKEQFFTLTAARMMTAKPHTVGVDAPMGAAVELMAQHRITSLVVLDGETVVGVVQK
jgi:arabinose-5-phosphate isomerase